jgi:peptidoglycan/LPS O-acetylase OafA/YrhL
MTAGRCFRALRRRAAASAALAARHSARAPFGASDRIAVRRSAHSAVGINRSLELGLALARLSSARALPAGAAALAAALLLPLGLVVSTDAVIVAGLAALVPWLGAEAAPAPAPRDLLWRLGEASFGVYPCWIFVEAALVLALRATDPGMAGRLVLMGGGLVGSFALGWLAWRFVELPAARLLTTRPRGPDAAPVPQPPFSAPRR